MTELISGLYCTQNKTSKHELMCAFLLKENWESFRTLFCMNLESDSDQQMSVENLAHIGRFLFGELPLPLTELSIRGIKELDTHVSTISVDSSVLDSYSDDEDNNIEEDDDEEQIEYTDIEQEEKSYVPDRVFIPFVKAHVDVNIAGGICVVKAMQGYVNDGTTTLEAVFILPKQHLNTSKRIGVCSFEATVGNRKIVTQVKEIEEAKAIQTSTKKRGEGCYLYEQSNSKYVFAVGSVNPGEQIQLVYKFIHEMTFNPSTNKLEMLIPPYMLGPTNANLKNPCKPGVYDHQASARIVIAAHMTSKVEKYQLVSPFKSVHESSKYGDTFIDLSGTKKDSFSLGIALPLTESAGCVLASRTLESISSKSNPDEEMAAVVSVVPRLSGRNKQSLDFLILTGSGIFAKPTQVRALIDAMPEDSRFNIISSYGADLRFFSEKMSSKEDVEEAIKFLTTSAEPSKEVEETIARLMEQVSAKSLRVVMVTDSWNLMQFHYTLDQIRRVIKPRVFLATRLEEVDIAETCIRYDVCPFASNDHYSETDIARDIVAKARNRRFHNVSVEFSCKNVQVIPKELPSMYENELFQVHAFLAKTELPMLMKHRQVVVKALSEEGAPFEEIMEPRVVHATEQNFAHLALVNNFVATNEHKGTMIPELKRLCVEYGLMSKHTAAISCRQEHEGTGFQLKVKHKPVTIRKKEKKIVYDYYGGGSGEGTFERVEGLALTNINDDHYEQTSSQISFENILSLATTSFGVPMLANPSNRSDFSHVFKGPTADVEGHNCWLNALVSFLMSSGICSSLMSNTEVHHDVFLQDLKLLCQIWLKSGEVESQQFRNLFDFMYRRVWYHLQLQGMHYGEDQDVTAAFKVIMEHIQTVDRKLLDATVVVYSTDEIPQENAADEILLVQHDHLTLPSIPEGYVLSAFVSFQRLAERNDGSSVNHLCTIYPAATGGFFVYDDILKFGNGLDFQGGYIPRPSAENIAPFLQHCPLVLLRKKSAAKQVANIEMTNVVSMIEKLQQEVRCSQEVQTPQTLPEDLSLVQAVAFIRLVRFACHSSTVVKVPQSMSEEYPLLESKSESKLRLLLKQELEMILNSSKARIAFSFLAESGFFNCIFNISSSITLFKEGAAAMMKQTTGNPLKLLGAFLSVFAGMKAGQKPAIEYFLKGCLLFSNKEMADVSSQF